VERDTSRAATDVEDASPHKPHRAALLRRPGAERCEIPVGIAGEDASVVALDDLDNLASCDQIAQQMTERVLLERQGRAQQAGSSVDQGPDHATM